jgi:hypothetical protein
MMCELESQELFRRGGDVCELLGPLTGSGASRAGFDYRSSYGQVSLAAFSGPRPVSDSIDLWRFTTRVPTLRGSYFERWLPVNERRKRYFLDRGYLHLYVSTRMGAEPTEKQILALHCDPNEPEASKHWRYKRGPHLHISVAESPIPHSHFALNAFHLDSVLRSTENLSEAFGAAVKMLEDQVLELYKKAIG